MRHCATGLVLWFFLAVAAWAGDFSAEVKHAEVSRQGGYYFLAADLDYHLSAQAKEALQNGVPLFWLVKVRLNHIRAYWWDKTLLKYTLGYQLQYHVLLNMYRVKNAHTGDVHNFSTLPAALDSMAVIRNLPLISEKSILPNQDYTIAIKILFEENKLPLPLQTQTVANAQWQLSSDWTDWHLFADKVLP